MKSILEEAKELIEMSLQSEVNKDQYTQKASQWLERVSARQAHIDTAHEGNTCEVCGFDLVCPNCAAE